MYGYIYLTENLVNHKKYIGMHKCSTFDTNYIGSGVLLNLAVKKYGKENFTCTILKSCDSKDELLQNEKDFICRYNAVESNEFYNIANGGQGGDLVSTLKGDRLKRYKESLKKCGTKGRIWINNGIEAKMIYPYDLAKFELLGFHKGNIPFTEDHKKKLSNSNKGKNSGRRWHKSQESKNKVKAEKNPMWGTTYKWVNDNFRNYRWPLDKVLPDGYTYGKIRRISNA